MKRILLFAFFALIAVSTWAAKANSTPFKVTQPDGTTVTVRLMGDENFSWHITTDGTLLKRVGKAFYIANTDIDGNLIATSQLAHEPAQRSVAEVEMISAQDKDAFFVQANQTARKRVMMREPIGVATPSYFPHTGSPKAIVLLAQFSDVKFSIPNTQAVFGEYLNSPNHPLTGLGSFPEELPRNSGSVKQYFTDMSFGQFTPNFDVYAPITLPQPMAFYGAGGENMRQLMADACTAANDQVNFSQYDSDNDGFADLVYVIYAGYGESIGGEKADPNTIWPKSGWDNGIGTFDGKRVSRYGVNNELNGFKEFFQPGKEWINGIGLFCHEFSHTLGMADMYPTDTLAYVNNQEMEYWDVMDGGTYTERGYSPTPYTAWEREAMGWFTITTLTEQQTDIAITPVTGGGQAYKIVNPADPTEYMVIENIQNKNWAKGVPGHGLLVYHVNWPAATVNLYDSPNNVAGKPGMAVVPADGVLLSAYIEANADDYMVSQEGDPFPGTSNVTELTFEQGLPNYLWYTGGPTMVQTLKNITEDTATGVVTFDYDDDVTNAISQFPTIDNRVKDNRIFSIDGRFIGTDTSNLPKGIYIIGGKKIIVN